jgi:dihydroxy-acid dehydratase
MLKMNSLLTQTKSQGASQAMLYATGLTPEDMNKPQIGICPVWFEGNPCNMHLLSLSEAVKRGITQKGKMVGYRFNTIGEETEVYNVHPEDDLYRFQ